MSITEIRCKSDEEWVQRRKEAIGGSDAAAVIGMSPYKSPYELWAEKRGMIEGFTGNTTTRVGQYLEDLVATMWSEETGKKVRRKNAMLKNDLYPFAHANLDRVVVGEDAFLEIKTTNSVPIMRAIRKSTEFPEAYYAQVVHYMAVTGMKKAYLAVLVNCRELYTYELERDEAEIAALMDAERIFWSHVTNGTAPGVDGSESCTEALRAIYPNSTGDKVDLWSCDSYLEQYTIIGRQIKELKKLQDECANHVKEFMQEAGKGESGRFKVSYTTQERKTFDAKRFEAENKSMDLSDYYKISQSRVFKVTEK